MAEPIYDQNGRHPPGIHCISRALCEAHYNAIFYPETLIGDDDELLDDRKSTDEQEEVVPDLGESAVVLRAEFARVAVEYTAFKFNTEGLRLADARSEALILTFLHLEDFTFRHPDVYTVLSDIFCLPRVRRGHSPPQQLFKRVRLLKLSRSTPELIRPNIATLNPHALGRHKNLPFVTARVSECLDDLEVR